MSFTEIINLPNKADIYSKIIINNKEIQINVSFILIDRNNENNENSENNENNEYYEIKTNKGVIFKIDKKYLQTILFYIDDKNSYIPMKWEMDRYNKKFITSKFSNSYINIINYLKKDYSNLTNKKLNVNFINKDYYDFRLNNIENIKPLDTKKNKFKIVNINPVFFSDNTVKEIKVIKEYKGHKISVGSKINKERNKYKLIEATKTDNSKYKYYEVGLHKFDINNNEYKFIIDEEDKSLLDTLYFTNNKVFYKETDIPNEDKEHIYTIKNPTWYLLDSQYVVSSITIKGFEPYLVYIHRLLLNCHKTINNTVDHINSNKFDNRKTNLRITSMSVQNQNRDIIKREKNLDYYLNPENKPEIPKLSFDNLLFISFRENTNEYFDIEFKSGRNGTDKDIKKHSTKAIIFKDNKFNGRRIKLCHAICIRYLTAVEYPHIIVEKIDNKKFDTLESFKNYANILITEIMNTNYTIDTFLDYMKTLQIPKYIDHRTTNNNTINKTITEMKFNFITYNSSRDKYDVDVSINKKNNPDKKIKLDGSGSKKINNEDKKCFALVQRYNLFIILENDINTQIHGDNIFTGNTNINTSSFKSLTDFVFLSESKNKFTNFDELQSYTEDCINKLLRPETQYTLETFVKYINDKANSKKVNLQISKLKYNYPILTTN